MTTTAEDHIRPMRPPDLALAERMAAGDRAAFAEVYTAHRDAVFTAAYRLVGHAAADVTHDAFVQAFERAATYRGEAPLGGWIRRIAINLALKRLRRDRWLSRWTDRWAAPRLARPTTADAIDLDRAIMALPATLRTPFVLHVVEGYPHAEIAERLGIGEAACRQRVHRARARLARALSEEKSV